MSQTTEELSRDVQSTRDDLAHDLDALQDRVSPSAIVERRKAAARGRFSSANSRVMGSADSARSGASSAVGSVSGAASNVADTAEQRFEGAPLAAGLAAFGAGMVIASLFPASDKEAQVASRAVEQAKEQGQPLLEQAKSVGQDIAADATEQAKEAAQQVKDSATDSASHVQEEGKSSAQSVKDDATA